MIFRRLQMSLLLSLAAVLTSRGADPGTAIAAAVPATVDPSLARYQTVAVEPAKTSIYIGSVTLASPTFVREKGGYASTYSARVFPYFFYNEKGRIWIDFSDDDLRAVARGETVNFTGRGRSASGEERRVEGRVQPDDANSGKIKVRIFVSKKIELIFNTTYRFSPANIPPGPSK